MKKNITINLFGQLYAIDEDAVKLLEEYLENMKRYFSRQDGGDEIADDIEHRVAELFAEMKANGVEAISIEHVQDIIRRIGNPEDMGAAEEGGTTPPPPPGDGPGEPGAGNGTDPKGPARRTLYRDPDDKLLGGVMAGLCRFFGGTDPLPWRIILVILSFFSFQIVSVIYLIAWALIPQAKTSEERLRMQGKPVTPETLNEELMKTTRATADYLRSRDFRASTQSTFRSLLHFLATGIRIAVLFFLAIVLLGLVVLLGLILFGAWGTAEWMADMNIYDHDLLLVLQSRPGLVWQMVVAAVSGCACVFIALFGLLRSLLVTQADRALKTSTRIVLTIVCILSLATAVTFTILSCVQLEGAHQTTYIQANTKDGYFMRDYDRDRAADLGWKVQRYANCNFDESLFRTTGGFEAGEDCRVEYMRFNRHDNLKPMEVWMERQVNLPAGRYHLEAIGYAAGKGVQVYARNGKELLAQKEIPLDNPDGKGNMQTMSLDSLVRYDFFKPLKGEPVNEDFDDHKEGWSIVRSASFAHAGGPVDLGICNQAKLLGQPANDFPARKFGLMDLRLVADSLAAAK